MTPQTREYRFECLDLSPTATLERLIVITC